MKKRAAVLLALAFLLLLAGMYFLAPVRPALAGATANWHIQERYGAYGFPLWKKTSLWSSATGVSWALWWNGSRSMGRRRKTASIWQL